MNLQIKKIIPYLIILIALVGFFGLVGSAGAQEGNGTCMYQPPGGVPTRDSTIPKDICEKPVSEGGKGGAWVPAGDGGTSGTGFTQTPQQDSSEKSDFETAIDKDCQGVTSWSFTGCLLKFVYYTYFQLPALILWLAAQFFNAMIPIGLSSKIISSSAFIPAAWGVVRDFSNIFFILILLYVAIKMILGLGGHDNKKMIASIIIMAMLINFSMFFTKIVIDSSNILALVFYNKLDTSYTDSTGAKVERPNDPSTPYSEKDLSGAMYKNFNATNMIDGGFIEALKTTNINGDKHTEDGLPFAITFGIMVIAGSIMLAAAYVFFVAGFMFLGRLIELWVLIIFSPFAFMSFVLPKLAGMEYIGWDAWIKRLVATSFMAPIFLFFMYLIFKVLEKNIFQDFTSGDGAIAKILGILIPAMIILALLMKAAKFAEKGGGQFGEIITKGGKMVGGLAITAATATASGGTALAARGIIGGAGGAGLGKLADKAGKSKNFRWASNMLQDSQKFVQGRSFDVRNVKVAGKTLAGATGLNLGEANKGGWAQLKKEQMSKRQQRNEELKKRASAGTQKEIENKKIELHAAEIKLKEKELPVKLKLDEYEKDINKARQELNDAKAANDIPGIKKAAEDLKEVKKIKKDLRESSGVKGAEKARNEAKNAVEQIELVAENKEHHATKKYADWTKSGLSKTLNLIARGGSYSVGAADEAARKIEANIKIDPVVREKKSGGDSHGHAPKPAASKPSGSAPSRGHAPAAPGH
jgi:hypothetical protein